VETPPDPPTIRARLRRDLARTLLLIEGHDLDYELRNALVLHALAAAAFLGYPAGFRIDPAEPDWPVAFIELPLPGPGQVSWHLPKHPKSWDLHTTAEKYARVRAFAGATVGETPNPQESPAVARLLALADLVEALGAGSACSS
jgi:hypothetical protein